MRQREPVRFWGVIAALVGMALARFVPGIDVPEELIIMAVAGIGLLARRDAWSQASVDKALTEARRAVDTRAEAVRAGLMRDGGGATS